MNRFIFLVFGIEIGSLSCLKKPILLSYFYYHFDMLNILGFYGVFKIFYSVSNDIYLLIALLKLSFKEYGKINF